jgi:hypothetical protein
MSNHIVSVSVECYSGSRGEETPRRFGSGDELIEVDEVLDFWLAPDHRYFKVRARGDVYILRNDVMSGTWEISRFERGSIGT